MPYRFIKFVNNYYYHVLNRGVGQKTIFQNSEDFQRCLEIINFYRFDKPIQSFSRYITLKEDLKKNFWEKHQLKDKLVSIISFCIMPNHIHLLVKQNKTHGISTFMSHWQNSYARYFNLKYGNKGYLFESNFKASLIEDDPVLWHVSRYIHLNPSTSSLVDIQDLEKYPWSSLAEYLVLKHAGFTDTHLILEHFGGRKAYREFVLNQAAYQKKLHLLKKLAME